MIKEQKFSDMIDLLHSFSETSVHYQHKPQMYGDEKLYMAEAHFLRNIGDLKEPTITELSDFSKKTKSAVSQMANKLCERGLIEKNKRQGNKKEVRLTLTERGEAVYSAHQKYDNVLYSKYIKQLDGFSSEDINKIMKLLVWIKEDLENNTKAD